MLLSTGDNWFFLSSKGLYEGPACKLHLLSLGLSVPVVPESLVCLECDHFNVLGNDN